MERKITKELMRWKSDPNHLPLIVTGCRQIGKTYSIKEFVSREYESHIYINFETQAEKKDLFKGDRSAEELISRIILSEGVRMHAGKSAIVLDEIQDCPEAYSALKPLSEDRRYDIICSGSFLGLNPDGSDRLSPLGYVDVMEMHPMDFEEYLWAMGSARSSSLKSVPTCRTWNASMITSTGYSPSTSGSTWWSAGCLHQSRRIWRPETTS